MKEEHEDSEVPNMETLGRGVEPTVDNLGTGIAEVS
jgi:hypothetical protein